ncbi:MAG: hypothetical protein Q7O66_16305 [Dehalococcoidia bacterium]|nr:hypothetical protein [Dehalococcoidia bacterium]
MVVGTTTLAPGQATFVRLAFAMHEGMGGPHLFEVVVPSNDPIEPEKTMLIRAVYPLP